MTHCPTCAETRSVVAQLGERMPGLAIEVVDLERPGVKAPPEVFSIPTYVFNGAVVALGNPYVEQLEASIRRHAPEPRE